MQLSDIIDVQVITKKSLLPLLHGLFAAVLPLPMSSQNILSGSLPRCCPGIMIDVSMAFTAGVKLIAIYTNFQVNAEKHLFCIARRLLATLANSADSEQYSSLASHLITNSRSSLSVDLGSAFRRMIDVITTAQLIKPPFPTGWQWLFVYDRRCRGRFSTGTHCRIAIFVYRRCAIDRLHT
uniref:Uncharacterized protein n=1 Tax=Romanomermis culicivorax TaxID=13658 RepID=A0A915JSD6_ROMCU